MQLVDPVVLLYVFTVQFVQEVDPDVLLKVPAAQLVHDDDPVEPL